MSRLERFGQSVGKTGNFGQGNLLRQLPAGTVPVTYADFRGGFDARSVSEVGQPNASPDMLDMDITALGRLKRLPGTTAVAVNGFAGKATSKQIILHANLSGYSELIFVSFPSVGVYRQGTVTWTDVGMLDGGRPVSYTVFGDDLILYSGKGNPVIKKLGVAPVATTKIPAAEDYTVFASRVIAGGATIDGTYHPMGMNWSGISGSPEDFTGEGSGAELLVDNPSSGDRVVAVRSMNLGMMAILCRHSIWVGTFTGQLDRPADFQPRVPGAGCFNKETARATPIGVIYGADDGIRAFDGNQSRLISEQINSKILPFTIGGRYSSMYDPLKNRYWLFTPTDTWIYEISFGRWLRSSMIAHGGTLLADQLPGTTWAQVVGNWSAFPTTTWRELSDRESDNASLHFFFDSDTADPVLHKEDAASATYFGIGQNAYWTTPISRGQQLNSMVLNKGILCEYTGSGGVRFQTSDSTGSAFRTAATKSLGLASTPQIAWIPFQYTGLGVQLKWQILGTASIEVAQVQLLAAPAGPRVEAAIAEQFPMPSPAPAIWLDAQQLVLSEGNAVSQWDDMSGNGRHFTVATGGPPWGAPTFRSTGLNGKPYVEFDGVDDLLSFNAAGLTVLPQTVILVLFWPSFVASANGNGAWSLASLGSNSGYGYGALNFGSDFQGAHVTNIGWITVESPRTVTPLTVAVIPRGTDPDLSVYKNGTWFNDMNSGAAVSFAGVTRFVLGALYGDQATAADARIGRPRIGEVLWYNRELTEAEILSLYNNHLKPRWGLP